MPVSPHRTSRAASAIGSLAAMALIFAASCGRDVTDSAPMTRGSVRLSTKAFQTTSTNTSGGDDVSFVRVVISAVTASATAGGSGTTRVLANVVIEADTVGGSNGSGNETDSTAGSVTVGFPIQGAGVTY